MKGAKALRQGADRWLLEPITRSSSNTGLGTGLTGIVVGLGLVAVGAGVLVGIDEVVTVTGQLEALTGSVDVKTPAGGKVASVFFQDGELVKRPTSY